MDFMALAQQCAPDVHPQTMAAVARVESSFNPLAIGVVGARLERQPQTLAEAVATAKALDQAGYNFSLGVGQVNRHNLSRFGLDYESAFDPCANLRAGAAILKECFDRARVKFPGEQQALQASFSCYYSGNFRRGFQAEAGGVSYVQKVLRQAGASAPQVPALIAVQPLAAPRINGTDAPPFRVTLGAPPAADVQPAVPQSVYGTAGDAYMVFR